MKSRTEEFVIVYQSAKEFDSYIGTPGDKMTATELSHIAKAKSLIFERVNFAGKLYHRKDEDKESWIVLQKYSGNDFIAVCIAVTEDGLSKAINLIRHCIKEDTGIPVVKEYTVKLRQLFLLLNKDGK